ncbi:MAG: thioredoxin [archaeon]
MENDKVLELTSRDFDDFVKEGVVLVDFWAEWCMPCLMMAPVIEELSERLDGKVKFGKVNTGDNSQLAQRFGVRSIPNFVLFKDGKPVEQFVGSMSGEEMEEKLGKFI